jgi:hypothetical protein
VRKLATSEMLQKLGYSLQSNRKTKEGASHQPDRNAQFEPINRIKVKDYLKRGDPVISVDMKKKEFVGDFKNNGGRGDPADNPGKYECMISPPT